MGLSTVSYVSSRIEAMRSSRMKPLLTTGMLACAVCLGSARGDALVLRNGSIVTGDIIRADEKEITIAVQYGVHRYRLADIGRIASDDKKITLPSIAQEKTAQRFPSWRAIYGKLVRQPWAGEVRQIPGVVIDKGLLKNVPYISFRAGDHFELNIYGDPDQPAGVELGVYDILTENETAQRNCRELLSSLFESPLESDAVMGLGASDWSVRKGNVLFEVATPSAADSFGGWWIGAYRTADLDAARATPDEIARISEPLPKVKRGGIGWSADEVKLVKTIDDKTDRLFAKGYFRKEGAYVAPDYPKPQKKWFWPFGS